MNSSNAGKENQPATVICCPVVELRQYTVHPGKRDALIELFEREFIESEEALGISVIGQFRDLDDPKRFVWLRGFQGMEARGSALAAFYGGPVWKAHREAANATMLDSDNVLLLRPVDPNGGFVLGPRHTLGASDGGARAVVVATIYYLETDTTDAITAFFKAVMVPKLVAAGSSILAVLVTEASPNNFLPLPVRGGDHAFLWFSAFAAADALERHRLALRQPDGWREGVSTKVLRQLMRKPEILTLAPTRRSLLR